MTKYLLIAAAFCFAGTAYAADKKIERLWKSKCASCHGQDGKGATEKGKKMKVADLSSADFQKKTDDEIKKAIQEGVKSEKDGVKKEMDPYKDEIKDDQLTGVIAFIRELKK